MEPASFFAASRLVIVAGKGGVGKTVVSAALARAAAAHGVRTLLVEATGTAALHRHFGVDPLTYTPVVLQGEDPSSGRAAVHGRAITPDEALVDYLEGHGMRRVARRLARSGTLEVIATATPGIKDILVLGKVKQLTVAADTDLIVMDAPAAGHATGLLRAAPTLVETARSGPIQHQAAEVLALLRDPTRCHVMLIATPEETPVNELIETAYSLEEDVGVRLAPVVVNGLYPEIPGLDGEPATTEPDRRAQLVAAANLRLSRQRMQRHHVTRLRRELPLEQLELPFLFRGDDGPGDSEDLSAHLLAAIHALPDHALTHD